MKVTDFDKYKFWRTFFRNFIVIQSDGIICPESHAFDTEVKRIQTSL